MASLVCIFYIIGSKRSGGSPDGEKSPPPINNGAATRAFVALPAFKVLIRPPLKMPDIVFMENGDGGVVSRDRKLTREITLFL